MDAQCPGALQRPSARLPFVVPKHSPSLLIINVREGKINRGKEQTRKESTRPADGGMYGIGEYIKSETFKGAIALIQ